MSERRFGVLIASSLFSDEPLLEDLRCPENDVGGFNEMLTSKDHGQFTETLILKNKPHHEVLRNINRILRQASKDDLVLIYFSGHGKLNPAGRLHLATVDTVFNELEATSIPVEIIRSYIDISASRKVVLILDCCFAGAAGDAFTKTRSDVGDQLQLMAGGRGTYIMTASTGIQVAQEKESDKYGVFTKHIIEGIRHGAADLNSDGRITMSELYEYVHDKVLDEGFQEPMKWDLSVRGELTIARSGKTPRQERSRQLKLILSDMWGKGILAEDIFDKARQVMALEPSQLSGDLRTYDDLLEQLLQQRIEPVDFVRKWYEVSFEAEAKRKARVEKRRQAKAEAKRRAEEEKRRKAEEEAERKAKEKKRQEAERRRRIEQEQKRRREQEELERNAEEEQQRRAEAEARRRATEKAEEEQLKQEPHEATGRTSYWKAIGFHLLFGHGLFYVDKNARRKWIYPVCALYIPLLGFLNVFPAGIVVIGQFVYLLSFIDVILTCQAKRSNAVDGI